jgi:hypothetical protein
LLLLTQKFKLLVGFHSFSDDEQAEAASHRDDRRRDRRIILVPGDSPDEGTIDLEEIGPSEKENVIVSAYYGVGGSRVKTE